MPQEVNYCRRSSGAQGDGSVPCVFVFGFLVACFSLGLPGSASTQVMCKAGQAGKRREGLFSSGAPGSFLKRAITSSEVGRIPS